MSQDNIEEADVSSSCCASCGKAEIDDIKLKECDDCDKVKYCSDSCREDHKSEHEEDCEKRAAELRDELLFKQPQSSHMGDCPICCVPLSLDKSKSVMMACCSKLICAGCDYANQKREAEMRLQRHSCPFCRQPVPNTKEEAFKQNMKRVEMNDPAALCLEGVSQCKKGDYIAAFEYFKKAANLGNVEAHYHLAVLYHEGQGVEKDEGKAIQHTEEASIGGHPLARCRLGVYENRNGNIERAVKHLIIAATQGEDLSVKKLTTMYKRGLVSKEDLAATLRAHKAAIDATKSRQRKAAEN